MHFDQSERSQGSIDIITINKMRWTVPEVMQDARDDTRQGMIVN